MAKFKDAQHSARWHMLSKSKYANPSLVWYKVENGQWMNARPEFQDVREVGNRPYKRYTCQELVELKVEPKYERIE